MTKRKTNKKAGASSTVSKRTEDPPPILTERWSSTNILNSKINRRKSTLPNDAPKEPTMADPSTNNNTPPASVDNSNTTSILPPPSSRAQISDHITSLKLSTKDMEAETLRLQEILAAKKAELQERKKELMGRVKGNEFGRRWREVRRKRGRGGVGD